MQTTDAHNARCFMLQDEHESVSLCQFHKTTAQSTDGFHIKSLEASYRHRVNYISHKSYQFYAFYIREFSVQKQLQKRAHVFNCSETAKTMGLQELKRCIIYPISFKSQRSRLILDMKHMAPFWGHSVL